eukprot:SAG31_NODE_6935_length_1844_cov_1.910029_2_plen_405_part_00
MPKFEYRAINGWAAMHDPVFAQRSHLNDRAHVRLASGAAAAAAHTAASVTASNNGDGDFRTVPGAASSAYAVGYFVHSIWNLLQVPPINGGPRRGSGPPVKLFETHRRWFSPSCASAASPCQVCWSNQSLVLALIEATKSVLRAQPTARIMSISQEDNLNQCTSPQEEAITAEEGSAAGPLLRAINQIAAAVEDEFPHVAIDTLAYTYTQDPPKLTSARPNVIIRLCTNQVDFTKPLAHPTNEKFLAILRGWSAKTRRLFLWHYVADFGNLLQVFPNYHTIGEDIAFLAANTSVVGMFEEGPGLGQRQANPWGDDPTGPGPGTDMEELKDYVMATLLWDPTLAVADVVNEFVVGYFGAKAAPYVQKYLDIITAAATAAAAASALAPRQLSSNSASANWPATASA